MLIAFVIILAMFLPLPRQITTRGERRGKLASFREFLLLFIRDQVARPALGEHDYRRFLPFLWTIFLFVIVMNLLGMIPFMGSPTASLAVTGVLALIVFVVIHFNGIRANHGFLGYMKSFIPHIDMNEGILKILGPGILVMMFFIEVLSALIKSVVLAVRLFANMLAGHMVLFTILTFIYTLGKQAEMGDSTSGGLFWPVTLGAVVLNTILSGLELFVACLQAFVFTFLTAVFIGSAMHPEH